MRSVAYLLLSGVAIAAAVFLVGAFLMERFLLAWIFGVVIVLCMEGRVQVGKRTARGALFWAHLLFATLFFGGLTTLAFGVVYGWLKIATLALFWLTILTVLPLWYRGVREVYAAHSSRRVTRETLRVE